MHITITKLLYLKVQENPTGNFTKMYRHISKGAWTFSMQDHGWQVSDCTAEGLKAILYYFYYEFNKILICVCM